MGTYNDYSGRRRPPRNEIQPPRNRGGETETPGWDEEKPQIPPEPIVRISPIENDYLFPPGTQVQVKSATPEIILTSEEGTPIEVMADLIFEDIGGQELINISRSDIINGISVAYQPIKNLQFIQQQFNPNNIVPLQLTSDRFFANFSIKLEDKIASTPNVYRVSNGDIIIELADLNSDEQVEIEILTNGIIYEVDNL